MSCPVFRVHTDSWSPYVYRSQILSMNCSRYTFIFRRPVVFDVTVQFAIPARGLSRVVVVIEIVIIISAVMSGLPDAWISIFHDIDTTSFPLIVDCLICLCAVSCQRLVIHVFLTYSLSVCVGCFLVSLEVVRVVSFRSPSSCVSNPITVKDCDVDFLLHTWSSLENLSFMIIF